MGRRTGWILLGVYLALQGVLVVALWQTRIAVIQQFNQPEELERWNEYRDSMAAKSEEQGPVERRGNPSESPPVLVLFDENFVTLVAGSVIFSSILYWMLAIMILGAINTPSPIVEQEDVP